ncbi:hypothetical protein C0V70_02035 [Bacteriovorax stolpii]|uniref:Uncharacterized protein n=1 Tax=Bacteriovorax stolpii TaxID=960 RepID=A0A2K9NQ55_BACTC|nr:hypothetical protein [Bacteriovorax stolpii]AUN96904.1 hypothetical protein C0V70_02035 [Bacteriovorax stolpii]TDP53183.1 hypothetical protein C8D79_1825 [Bacteriovorax stolpii]
MSAEQIITVSVMCLWFLFPIGMFVSVWRQQNDEKRTFHPTKAKRPSTIHVVPQASYVYEDSEDDINDEVHQQDYDYTKVPKRDSDRDTHCTNN